MFHPIIHAPKLLIIDNQMENLIKQLPCNSKPKLLLHSCCAPCSGACLERLKDNFDVTVYYYNLNMDTEEEFLLRAKEQENYCKRQGVSCVVVSFNSSEFYQAVKGKEKEK